MRQKSSNLSAIALFFALMLVIHLISQLIFAAFPLLPIKPTLNHLPVIVAAIVYGPRVGMTLGGLMGVLSFITATILITPASFLFTPLVPGGQWYSLLIAVVPRILIGLVPYLIYRLNPQSKVMLCLAGLLGSLTNTILVLSSIFFLFPDFFAARGGAQAVIAGIISTNSLIEMGLASFLALAIVPALEKLKSR